MMFSAAQSPTRRTRAEHPKHPAALALAWRKTQIWIFDTESSVNELNLRGLCFSSHRGFARRVETPCGIKNGSTRSAFGGCSIILRDICRLHGCFLLASRHGLLPAHVMLLVAGLLRSAPQNSRRFAALLAPASKNRWPSLRDRPI